MKWSLSLIITLAISIAISIVIVMMILGGPLGVTSSLVRTIGFAVASALGFLIGQYVHKTYVAK
jgi:hypothetical protein